MIQPPARKILSLRVLRETFRTTATAAALAAGAALVAGGCLTAPKVKPSLTHYDPAVKIPAIKMTAKLHDRSAVAQLVEDLDSDDPAVRFYSIRALRDLTGETFEYRYYDDDLERRPALERWRAWLAAQAPTTTTAPTTAPATAPATRPGSQPARGAPGGT